MGGAPEVWGRSPVREVSDSDAHTEIEDVEMTWAPGVSDAHQKKKKKKSKKEKKSKKKKKKSKKKKKKKSSSSDDSDSEDEWVEKDVMDAVAENKLKNKADESEEDSEVTWLDLLYPRKFNCHTKIWELSCSEGREKPWLPTLQRAREFPGEEGRLLHG